MALVVKQETASSPSGLNKLPPEIWREIVEQMGPAPELVRQRLTRRFTKAGSKTGRKFDEWQSGLKALCLTSRAWNSMATPILYHTVPIKSIAGLVKFFRTLVERPDKRGLVRHLYTLLTLHKSADKERCLDIWDSLVQSIRFPTDDPFLSFVLQSVVDLEPGQGTTHPGNLCRLWHLPEKLLVAITLLTSRLDTFRLQAPSIPFPFQDDDAWPYGRFYSSLQTYFEVARGTRLLRLPGFDDLQYVDTYEDLELWNKKLEDHGCPFLQNLTTIRLYGGHHPVSLC